MSERAYNTVELFTYFKGIDIVRKDDDLISAVFVIFDQELTSLKLVRIHAVQQHPLSRLFPKILAIELGGHRAPNLCTLRSGHRQREGVKAESGT